MQLKSEIY